MSADPEHRSIYYQNASYPALEEPPITYRQGFVHYADESAGDQRSRL
jgi:hypothetical protein